VGPTASGTLTDGSHIAGHWLSTGNATTPGSPFRVYISDATVRGGIGPADIWVVVDEDPDTLNDSSFAFTMPLGWPTANPQTYNFIDMPSKYHGNACGFSFIDGHTEIHKWLAPGAISTTT